MPAYSADIKRNKIVELYSAAPAAASDSPYLKPCFDFAYYTGLIPFRFKRVPFTNSFILHQNPAQKVTIKSRIIIYDKTLKYLKNRKYLNIYEKAKLFIYFTCLRMQSN